MIVSRSGEVRHQLEFGEAGGAELGKAYTVRVRAVNAAGPGPWSIESDQLVSNFDNQKLWQQFKKLDRFIKCKFCSSYLKWSSVLPRLPQLLLVNLTIGLSSQSTQADSYFQGTERNHTQGWRGTLTCCRYPGLNIMILHIELETPSLKANKKQ